VSILDTIRQVIFGVKTLGADVTLQAALYPFRKAYHSGRFAHVRGEQRTRGSRLGGVSALMGATLNANAAPPEYAFPGRVLAHHWPPMAKGVERQRIELICENAAVRIAVLAPDLIRVRVSPSGQFPLPFSYAVAREDADWPPVSFTVEQTGEAIWIRTRKLHCRVNTAHLSISFLDSDGTVIHADAAGVGWDAQSERIACWKVLPPDEHLYGLGQKTTSLDHRGRVFSMWNTDPQFYHPGEDPIYSNIPLLLGLHERRGYGLFYDNPARARFDLGAGTPGIAHYEADCGEMRYYGTVPCVVLRARYL